MIVIKEYQFKPSPLLVADSSQDPYVEIFGMKKSWILAHMRAAHIYASCSVAERLKVGVLVVLENSPVAVGINGTPRGWHTNICEEEVDGERHTKDCVIHAEKNAISKITRSTRSMQDASVFTTDSPCLPCAVDVHNSGVTQVFYDRPYRKDDGIQHLLICGVRVTRIDLETEVLWTSHLWNQSSSMRVKLENAGVPGR